VCDSYIHIYIYIWINRLDAGRIQIRLVACRSKLFWDPASRMEKYRAVLIWSFDGENLWWWKHVSQRGVCIIARVISVIIHGYIYSYYIYIYMSMIYDMHTWPIPIHNFHLWLAEVPMFSWRPARPKSLGRTPSRQSQVNSLEGARVQLDYPLLN
jgi:hypothetical protein